jgi:hypothetical protein
LAHRRHGEGREVTDDFGQDSRNLPLKPLAVSVKTAGYLLGVGETTTWGLISSGKIDVIRIGRRTLVTMASLEALVATLASSDPEPEQLVENRNEGLDKMNSIKMTLEEVKSRMSAAGIDIKSEQRLPNDTGTQIVTIFGHVVDVYDTGKAVVQGRDAARLASVLGVHRDDPKGPSR